MLGWVIVWVRKKNTGEEDEVSKVEGELLRRFQEDDVERNGYVPGTRVRNVLERTLHLSQPETLFLLSQCSIDSLGECFHSPSTCTHTTHTCPNPLSSIPLSMVAHGNVCRPAIMWVDCGCVPLGHNPFMSPVAPCFPTSCPNNICLIR